MSAGARLENQVQADAERYAKLSRAIAWLAASPKTTVPDVVAAQHARIIEGADLFALHTSFAVEPASPRAFIALTRFQHSRGQAAAPTYRGY